MANSLNLNPAYYYIFEKAVNDRLYNKNSKIKISKYYYNCVSLTNLSLVAKLNSVYISIL